MLKYKYKNHIHPTFRKRACHFKETLTIRDIFEEEKMAQMLYSLLSFDYLPVMYIFSALHFDSFFILFLKISIN